MHSVICGDLEIVPSAKAAVLRVSILSVVAAVIVGANGCRCGEPPSIAQDETKVAPVTSSPGFNPLLVEGPAVWNIDGREVRVRATYFLIVDGRLQFTVDYLCGDECSSIVGDPSEAAAFALAYPLMKYVVDHGLYERGRFRQPGSGAMNTELIGVALTQQADGKERGYRVSRTLEEIRGARAPTTVR